MEQTGAAAQPPRRDSAIEQPALAATLSDAILVLDADGRYLKVTWSDPDLSYKPAAELIGKTLPEIFPRAQAELFLNHIRRVLTTHQALNVEYSLRIGAQEHIFAASISPLLDDSVVWVTRDVTARKGLEQKIRDAETKYRVLVEQLPVITYVVSLELQRTVYISPQVETILGFSPDEWLADQQLWLRQIHPDDAARVAAALRARDRNQAPLNLEYRVLARDGRVVWLQDRAALVRDELGAGLYAHGVMIDITERKQIEEALRESERFARSTVDALSANIAILDHTGAIIAVNQAWRDFAKRNGGDPAKTAEGMNYLAVCDTATDAPAAAIVAGIRALIQGQQEQFALEYPCHSRWEQRWYIARVTRFPGGGPTRVVVAHENVTERKFAEEALASERDLFSTLMDNLPDLIYFKDSASRYIRVNKAQAAVLGLDDPQQVLGKSDFDFFTPQQAHQAFAAEQQLMANGQPSIGKLERIQRTDGALRWVSATKVPIRDLRGQTIGIVGLSRDVTEQKTLEDQLQYVKDYLETLIQSANDIIYTADLRGHFTFVNRRATELLGYAATELTGQHFARFIVPADRAAVLRAVRALAVDEPQSFELRLQTRDERIVELAVNATPIFEHGELVGTLGIARDMTAQKRLERQVQDVKEYLESLIANAGTAIATFELDGTVKTWNVKAETLFGYSAAELVGQRDTLKMVPAEQRAAAIALFQRARAGEIAHDITTERLHKDGSVHQVLLTVSPIRDVGGSVVAVCMTGNDISTRVRLERVLRAERDRLDAILSSMAEGVLVADADNRLILVNQAAAALIGQAQHELLGKSWDAVTLPFTRAELEAQLSPAAHSRSHTGHTHVRPWGGRMLDVHVTALRGAEGALVGTVSLMRDVTELTRVDQMKNEFISLVSHELRTPLTSIKGYTDLLLEGDAGPITAEQSEFLGIVKSNVDHLVTLINDLLDISKIEAGRITLIPAAVDLTLLVGEVIRAFKPQLEGKMQIVSADLPKESLKVLADRDRLSQVLWNLVSNAHKYSPPGARLQIRVQVRVADRHTAADPALVERGAPMLALSVQDEGIGIAPGDQVKLFTKFYRVDNSLTREVGGTGLGLAITKSFVELQGGRIWVESPIYRESGRGSRFTFTVPLAEGEERMDSDASFARANS